MARDDIRFGRKHGIIVYTQGSGDDVWLTSGCMLPFSEPNFFNQIENAAEYQGYATSGSVLHHFIEDELSSKKLANYIYNYLFEKPINYVTMSPSLTTCMTCGTKFKGKDIGIYDDTCTCCGSDDLAVFARVIGYVKPVARKSLKIKDGKYTGNHNFWSSARRVDWIERKKLIEKDIENFKE